MNTIDTILSSNVGQGAMNANPYMELNRSADDVLDKVLYKWPHKVTYIKDYTPSPVEVFDVKGHQFVFSYANSYMYVDGHQFYYRKGLNLYDQYTKYSAVHHQAIIPLRYRHTYYGDQRSNQIGYSLHGNYAYFTDHIKAHHKIHWIKYRLVKGFHDEILTINDRYTATPFKLANDHIQVMYNSTLVNLYR